jgi:hypothetical protein
MARRPLSAIAALLVSALGSAALAAPAPVNRIAIEVSPLIADGYVGGEYVSDESLSSTSVGAAYERRLWRYLTAGGVLTYVQPGTIVLPVVPGVSFRDGQHSTGVVRESGRMVLAQARLRLVLPLPFEGDDGEIGLAVQAGAAGLLYPGSYRGWGPAADASIDITWFWSSWGMTTRLGAGLARTEGTIGEPGRTNGAGITRVALALGAALVHRF